MRTLKDNLGCELGRSSCASHLITQEYVLSLLLLRAHVLLSPLFLLPHSSFNFPFVKALSPT